MSHPAANQPNLIPDEPTVAGPVTCLGLSFANDAERRAHFVELLRQKLRDPAFRSIEGFPIGTDEAILALSDPPYYTACPNPWLADFIAEWEAQKPAAAAPYAREPFAADVSEGKNDPIYNAHSYHTKVPHKAIMRYILHYTEPGDIVFDGFCGTGMTGVAAQLCGDRREVESLGYRVDAAGVVYDGERAISRLGARQAVLNDLSPAATFIAYNYNTPVPEGAFQVDGRKLIEGLRSKVGWMYETGHTRGGRGEIHYVVWSDIFICPSCSQEINFFAAAYSEPTGKVIDDFKCPNCAAHLTKRQLGHATESYFDSVLGYTIKRNKQLPVLISYSVGARRYTKPPTTEDLELVATCSNHISRLQPATYPMMHKGGQNWGAIWRSGYHFGVTHSHHFYTERNLAAIYEAWQLASISQVRWAISAIMNYVNKKQSFTGGGGGMPGVLYIPSLIQEKNVIQVLERKLATLAKTFDSEFRDNDHFSLSTQSSTVIESIESDTIDYIFVDPPFGANLMYSEGSFLWESWLEVFTNNGPEAIENPIQQKCLAEYHGLIRQTFSEFRRILKPGRWMTIEFHNSSNSVWNAIQESIQAAGFVVADVRTLDKKQSSFKQVTSAAAAKQDLVISAYKPSDDFERQFLDRSGTADGAWEFVRRHLAQLPVAVEADGGLERTAERQDYLLFDRMVAFHIQRGAAVPLSAAEFYAGLRRRFDERDGMFFLKEQIPTYEAARLRAGRVSQTTLFPGDEKSSIQWLRQQLDPALGGRPQTYQEIQPAFLRNLHQATHEALPELRDLLQDNFLPDDAGRWYAPDPNKAEDLERLRRRALLAEFETYRAGKGRLKQFRAEAVRARFADAYRRKAFDIILQVAARLPEQAIQEDPDLLMYVDAAGLRARS